MAKYEYIDERKAVHAKIARIVARLQLNPKRAAVPKDPIAIAVSPPAEYIAIPLASDSLETDETYELSAIFAMASPNPTARADAT